MLKEKLQERFDALVENGPDMEKEEFDINLEISDMTTIHESYQYLIKKYVDGNEDYEPADFLNLDDLKKRHEENKTKKLNANNDGQSNLSPGRKSR